MYFRYSHGRRLVEDRTAKSHLELSCITESKFADDAALYASTHEGFEEVASSFVRVARGWGLTVSLIKSKGMAAGIGADTSVLAPLTVEGGEVGLVEQFQYLGSIISNDGELYAELSGQLAKAAKMFGSLRQSICTNKSLSVEARRCVYLSTVVATLLYGSETWAVKVDQMRRLEVFHNCCVRGILGVLDISSGEITSPLSSWLCNLECVMRLECYWCDVVCADWVMWQGWVTTGCPNNYYLENF